MRNEILNPRVLALDDSHPAKKFLSAFIECRNDCVGLELDPDDPIDQEWESTTDGRSRNFSGVAYAFLALDLALDDFHLTAPSPNELTLDWPWDVPRFRALMHECAAAAKRSGNDEIVELTDQVLEMLGLWEDYLTYRREMIGSGSE